MSPSRTVRGLRLAASLGVIALVTVVAYGCHAKAFVAGFLYLFPLMVIAFRWGLLEAIIASVVAAGCLDFFFTQPLLHLYMQDVQDRIALACFEATFLVTSCLADRLRRYAASTEEQRRQLQMLYQMSREILYFDRRNAIGASLAKLIVDVFQVEGVSLWDASESRLDSAGTNCVPEDELRAIPGHGRNEDDLKNGRFLRVLLIGARTVGSLGIVSRREGPALDARTADAIASLAAVALERSHSFLAEAAAEASRQSERMRSTVLDGLAHSLKTPLATVQTASSGLMEMSGLSAAQLELASLINQQSIRLTELTNQALRTAKADHGQVNPRKEAVPVAAFLQEFQEECANDFPEHRVAIHHEPTGARVWADRRLLRMALLQLVDNAAKYGSPAAPIRISACAAGAELVFSVRNEGSYIVPEERMRIFQRFYRSPGSESRAPGTGIGLSIVRRAAEMHGGRVWTDSEPETGTIFYLSVPLREPCVGHAAG